MLRYKVCLSSDVTVGSVAGLNFHGSCVPPAPPIPMVPTREAPAPHFMPPGTILGQNKLTRRVTHRRAAIVQDGHDIGTMLLHIPPGPNALLPIHMLFAKRKAVFFEPRVRFEKRFAAPCSAFALMPAPMMSCNDPIALPIASTVTEAWNTVDFGMSLSSYLVSFAWMTAMVLAESVVKGVCRKAAPPKSDAATKWELWSKQFRSKLAGGKTFQEIAAKVGLEAGLGLTKLMLTSGDRTVSISTPGSPFLRLSVTVDEQGASAKGTLHGVSSDGSVGLIDAANRMGHDGPWGADLG